jgi:hypothetical protein
MSFDSSRFTFNSWNDFFGVVMQQGRVQVDADWNEWIAELNRRIQAGTLDTFGRAVVPQTTPDGFKITFGTDTAGNAVVLIGPGRMYVDGLLAENHGLPAPSDGGWTPGNVNPAGPLPSGLGFDTALAELVGQNPVPVNQQPYLPTAASFPTTGGPYLVYLDVWQRDVTFIEDPDLVEKAVGVDTTGRLQTVWQVKWLDVSQDGNVTCSTPDASIPEWEKLLLPPGPQLTTGVVQSSPSGPCCLAPNTGYTGLENQLYRVEIHQGGAPGTGGATFKWSRDNASVATGVTAIGQGGNSLIVQSTGRDDVLRFSANDWLEITDDYLELQGLPGELHQIATVTDASSTITLYTPVLATNFPVDANGQTTPSRHTRIRRWDQSGKIYQSDGVTVWTDLGAAGAKGDIPVPPPGTTLILENGVTVAFSEAAVGSAFQSAQFWTFAARSTDGTVEFLNATPPRGIYHHYARLSVITLPGTASNCRTPWPPNFSLGCCGCTVNVQPSDLTGNVTLQTVIDQYQNQNLPVTICLAEGNYALATPLRLTGLHRNLAIEACQKGAVTISVIAGQDAEFTDGLLVLDGAINIALRRIGFALPNTVFSGSTFAGLPVNSLDPGVTAILQNLTVSIGVRTVNIRGLTIEDCTFAPFEEYLLYGNRAAAIAQGYRFAAGIFSTGSLTNVQIARNFFRGGGDFSAGFLHAPSASFVNPNSPLKIVGVQAGVQAKAAATLTASRGARASTRAKTAPTLRAREAVPTDLNPIAAQPAPAAPIPPTGLVDVSVLKPAFSRWETNFGINVQSAAQASNGGTAIPALLRSAVLENNTFGAMSTAVLVLGATESLELKGNQIGACRAGFWILTPQEPFLLLNEAQQIGVFGLSLAIGYPLPAGDTSTTVTVSASPAPVRIFTGSANYTDTVGHAWVPDIQAPSVSVTASNLNQPTPPPQINNARPAAADQVLYQSERWSPDFTYTFQNLAAGFYMVTVKLAEIVYTTPGQRDFNVFINGTKVLNLLDLVSQYGYLNAADLTFLSIPSVNAQITIEFTGIAGLGDGNAKCSAIEILPEWSPDFISFINQSIAGGQIDDVQNFFLQIVLLAQQGFLGTNSLAMQLRVESNEMQALSSVGLMILGSDSVQNGAISSLIVTGNRLSGSLSLYQFIATNPNQDIKTVFTKASGAFNRASYYGLYIESLAFIFYVARCIVASNMIVNDASGESRGSLLLLGGTLNSPDAITPPPEVSVTGNVFKGSLLVSPSRGDYFANVPYPMNTWDFFNTVIY